MKNQLSSPVNVEDISDTEREEIYECSNAGRKRNYHNILERKRRNHIKDGYWKLRDSIPDVEGKKVSRIQILKRAVERISFLRANIKKRELYVRELKLRLKNEEF
ncbi:BHLH domain-containing protein [Trichonephila clavata]|uniref:BHLH domain-containing protein n=1 Tax=Trichonephila clavata TaxID=2740835 RepID=A0A8X6H0P4_TRICU|nr:BHLH domain-containing protein [Trichonephila clavata]